MSASAPKSFNVLEQQLHKQLEQRSAPIQASRTRWVIGGAVVTGALFVWQRWMVTQLMAEEEACQQNAMNTVFDFQFVSTLFPKLCQLAPAFYCRMTPSVIDLGVWGAKWAAGAFTVAYAANDALQGLLSPRKALTFTQNSSNDALNQEIYNTAVAISNTPQHTSLVHPLPANSERWSEELRKRRHYFFESFIPELIRSNPQNLDTVLTSFLTHHCVSSQLSDIQKCRDQVAVIKKSRRSGPRLFTEILPKELLAIVWGYYFDPSVKKEQLKFNDISWLTK